MNEIDEQHTKYAPESSINCINDIHEVISLFSDIFVEKIVCAFNIKVTLELREGAIPVFHRERDVSYALRNRVNQELDSLEAAGIITKEETSD